MRITEVLCDSCKQVITGPHYTFRLIVQESPRTAGLRDKRPHGKLAPNKNRLPKEARKIADLCENCVCMDAETALHYVQVVIAQRVAGQNKGTITKERTNDIHP